MQIDKNNIPPKDTEQATRVLNHLRQGQFVIGNPGLGLRKTLKTLEAKFDESNTAELDWHIDNAQLIAQIAATRAGITGEENLCEYLAKLIKYDKNLRGIVAFASLSYEQDNNNLDYIPDTDTLLVLGKNLLVIDAKNLKTKAGKPLMLDNGFVLDEKGKPLIHVNSSTNIWKKIMSAANIEIDNISEFVCIVNNTDTPIIETEDEEMKLIHIAQLHQKLVEWATQHKTETIYLNILTEISKAQIYEDKSDCDLDIANIRKQFGV